MAAGSKVLPNRLDEARYSVYDKKCLMAKVVIATTPGGRQLQANPSTISLADIYTQATTRYAEALTRTNSVVSSSVIDICCT